ncbi:unnamed protein product [Sphagnum balticum]
MSLGAYILERAYLEQRLYTVYSELLRSAAVLQQAGIKAPPSTPKPSLPLSTSKPSSLPPLSTRPKSSPLSSSSLYVLPQARSSSPPSSPTVTMTVRELLERLQQIEELPDDTPPATPCSSPSSSSPLSSPSSLPSSSSPPCFRPVSTVKGCFYCHNKKYKKHTHRSRCPWFKHYLAVGTCYLTMSETCS